MSDIELFKTQMAEENTRIQDQMDIILQIVMKQAMQISELEEAIAMKADIPMEEFETAHDESFPMELCASNAEVDTSDAMSVDEYYEEERYEYDDDERYQPLEHQDQHQDQAEEQDQEEHQEQQEQDQEEEADPNYGLPMRQESCDNCCNNLDDPEVRAYLTDDEWLRIQAEGQERNERYYELGIVRRPVPPPPGLEAHMQGQ